MKRGQECLCQSGIWERGLFSDEVPEQSTTLWFGQNFEAPVWIPLGWDIAQGQAGGRTHLSSQYWDTCAERQRTVGRSHSIFNFLLKTRNHDNEG